MIIGGEEYHSLKKKDYEKILRFYRKDLPKNKQTRKRMAENILARKLCKCIKKVRKPSDKNEGRATAICRQSVINKKDLTSFGFTCKKKMILRKKKGKTFLLLKRTRKRKEHAVTNKKSQ